MRIVDSPFNLETAVEALIAGRIASRLCVSFGTTITRPTREFLVSIAYAQPTPRHLECDLVPPPARDMSAHAGVAGKDCL